MLNKKILTELEKMLKKEQSEIEKNLKSIGAEKDPKLKDDYDTKFPSFGNHTSEQDENADEVEEFEANLAIEHISELRLRDVNVALKKIKNSRYGICEKCEKEIEIEKLRANPAAKFCLNCQK